MALVAYIPSLASAPGRMPTDTKLYLYLDPGGLVSRAASTFESAQYAGWVPHQQIAYLWPQGPWFWFFDVVSVPDWVAHRLWIGTLMFVAGTGVYWASRQLGLARSGAIAAGFVYQLSPYILAYLSRTSAMLLPWVAVGWIVGLVVRASTASTGPLAPGVEEPPVTPGWRDRLGVWRDPALIALIVATVGAVNATALILIVPAPLLCLVHLTWQRQLTWRRAVAFSSRVVALSFAVSLWWIGMLVVQFRHGAPVLDYTESLTAVSRSSTGSEVLRALGYWLFYYRDPFGPITTASLPYLNSLRAIAISYAVVLVGIVSVVRISWVHRRFTALLMAAGAVLAVGLHPIDDPSPLMALFTNDEESGLALALRSSTRAMPVFMLGVALATGAFVTALPDRRAGSGHRRMPRALAGGRFRLRLPSWRSVGAAGAVLLALANLPALRNAELADPAIDRDQDPPDAWVEAAERVDELSDGSRVLQLPGAEFGSFRWGYTLDQPMVGLSDTPLVTRDILPLGSAAAMDLLYAFDDRFQEGTIEVASVAPVARLFGADVLMLTNDMAFERYQTARPEIVDDLLTHAADDDLVDVERIGEPVANVAEVPMIDATSLLDPRVGQPLNPITLLTVDDGVPVIRAKTDSVIVSGSGDGVVDAAAAGLIDGQELLIYSGSLSGQALSDALADAGLVVVTDSNRDRARHWGGSQDVVGFTESGGPEPGVLDFNSADQRLEMFPDADPSRQTVSVQDGPVTASASSYGEPFAYRPEDRAVMAIDGDLTTAWTAADHGDPIGQRIRLELVDGATASDSIVLHQPVPAPGGTFITELAITTDDGHTTTVELTEESFGAQGQRVTGDGFADATSFEFEIRALFPGDVTVAASRAGVGFTEIDLGLEPTTEFIRLPTDALDEYATGPLAIVLTRLRVDPTSLWRSDPEPELRRSFTLPTSRDVGIEVTMRLDRRAADEVLATVLYGEEAAWASARLSGSVTGLGAAALDGDIDTSWVSPFDGALGASLTFDHTGEISTLDVIQRAGDFSPVTAVTVSDGVDSFEVVVPPPGDDGRSTLQLPPGLASGELTLTVSAIDRRTTVNRRYGEVLTLPTAIAEIEAPGLAPTRLDPQRSIEVECATDLLEIDGESVPVSFTTTVGALLDGEPVSATVCGGPQTLSAGEHRVVASNPSSSAFTVDRVVLTDSVPAAAGDTEPDGGHGLRLDRQDERHRTVTVDACPDGCWLVFGEGFNEAWSASVDGSDLGPPRLVDGGFNGWWLPPSAVPTVVEVQWTAQGPVTWGLIIGAASLVVLAGIVVLGRRRRPPEFSQPSLSAGGPVFGLGTVRQERVAAIVFVVACALLISPEWGLVALIPAAFVALVPGKARPTLLRRPFEIAGLASALYVVVAVLYIERRDRPIPDLGWTEHFLHLNGAALFALLALAAGTLVSTDTTRRAGG